MIFQDCLTKYSVFALHWKLGTKKAQTVIFSTSALAFSQSYSRMKGPKITSGSTVRRIPSKDSQVSGETEMGEMEELQATKPKYAKEATYSKFCNINIANTCEDNIYGNLWLFHFKVRFIYMYIKFLMNWKIIDNAHYTHTKSFSSTEFLREITEQACSFRIHFGLPSVDLKNTDVTEFSPQRSPAWHGRTRRFLSRRICSRQCASSCRLVISMLKCEKKCFYFYIKLFSCCFDTMYYYFLNIRMWNKDSQTALITDFGTIF